LAFISFGHIQAKVVHMFNHQTDGNTILLVYDKMHCFASLLLL
jgi:hypothetical protein